MSGRNYLVPFMGILLLVAAVVTANLTGHWVSTGRQAAARALANGELGPADIKGWMTFEEVSRNFSVPLDELMKGLGMTGVDPETPLRELEGGDFSPETVRQYVAEWLGTTVDVGPGKDHSDGEEGFRAVAEPAEPPIAVKEQTPKAPTGKVTTAKAPTAVQPVAPVVAQAVGGGVKQAVKPSDKPAPPQVEQPKAAVPDPAPKAPVAPGSESTSNGTGEHVRQPLAEGASPQDIRGFSTLNEVADTFGLAVADILREAGLPEETDPGMPMKDLKGSIPGFEVQVVRDAVEGLLK